MRRLVEPGLEAGIERIVLNHPDSASVGLSLVEQSRYAALPGVYLERSYLHTLDSMKKPVPVEEIIKNIRSTGVENNIISTDLGRTSAPSPWEGVAEWCRILTEKGFSRSEIEIMGCDNPRKIYFSADQ